MQLSVVMITKNAERLLDLVLSQAALIADEIVIVDSGSTDKTLEIARKYTQKIIETSDWPGFCIQKQKAVDAATGDWVLVLDSDEVLDECLVKSIQKIIKESDHDHGGISGYEIKRPLVFGGKIIRRAVSLWTLRLFKKEKGRFTQQRVHERLVVEGPIARISEGELLHYSYKSVSDWLERMHKYTDLFVEERQPKGEKGSKKSIGFALLSAFFVFIKIYFFKGAVLEGRMGLVVALNWAIGNYLKYLKLALRDEFDPPVHIKCVLKKGQ